MNSIFNPQLFWERRFDTDLEYEDDPIYMEISQTIAALNEAYAGFDEALDPDLIDSYIYEINALTLRYHFLLKQSKQTKPEQFS